MPAMRFRHDPSATVGAIAMLALLAGGCNSGRSAAAGVDITSTSQALAAPSFAAPFDPSMGLVVVAVPEVVISARSAAGVGDLQQTIRSQLVGALATSRNFQVAERQSFEDIALEHRLAESGATRESDRPEPGQLRSPRLLVKVDVTEMEEVVLGESKSDQVSLGWIAAIGSVFVPGVGGSILGGIAAANPNFATGTQTVMGLVGMEIRVIDVDSGTVVTAARAHASLKQDFTAQTIGIAGISTTSEQFSKSVAAHATRAAVEDAVVKIHSGIRGRAAVVDARR